MAVWRQVVRTVTPLPGRAEGGILDGGPATAVSPPSDRPAVEAPRRIVPPRPVVTTPSPGRARHALPEALRAGDGAGIDRRTHDRFRRGRMAIEARLDLHGMTRERAHHALNAFLRRAHDQGARCVLVVTGKGSDREGGGVLRRDVPRWLNQTDVRHLVLGFTPARPRDGGEGALYVLIKRRRERVG
nr:Smr/MutS family protein [Roseospira visakhapatnamensis]